MTSNSATQKQHYIPRFYLKRFADDKKALQVYNLKRNLLEKSKAYSALGYARYFYAVETGIPDEVSQKIEDWLGTYENIIASNLPSIIQRILDFQPITEDDKYILAALMCMLWLRSPKMRTSLNKSREDLTKQIMRLYPTDGLDMHISKTSPDISKEKRESLIKMLEAGSFNLKFNNVSHLKFMTETFGFGDKGFTNMFFGHKWKIFIAKGRKKFITTDSPVVEMWEPPKDFFGSSFLERDKYFPLTPDILIKLSFPYGSRKVNRTTLFENQDDTVSFYNILLAANSHTYAYSSDRTLLEELIGGRSNPRDIDKAYIQQFVIPWRKYRENHGITD